MPYSVYLKKNEEKRLLRGHSWVYANEVARIEGKDKNGALAAVYASDGRYIGKGYLNHLSKILVRIFIRDGREDDETLFRERIAEADAARRRLISDDCYRMVFAEADDLPALIIDRYGDVLVLQCLSLGISLKKEMIVRVLNDLFRPRGIYDRGDVTVRAKEGLPLESGVLSGEVPDKVQIRENGLIMSVDVKNGQKTGNFLDQKENRFACRRYAAGGRVMDCFCNGGGFSMNAATAATEVISADISALALQTVKRNAELNGFENIKTVQADVFELLREYKKSGDYNEIWYEHILVYFTYRYFMRAWYDGNVLAKAQFAIVGFLVIRDMDIVRYFANGKSFKLDDRIANARIFSREVEHSEETLEILEDDISFDEAFHVKHLLGQI